MLSPAATSAGMEQAKSAKSDTEHLCALIASRN